MGDDTTDPVTADRGRPGVHLRGLLGRYVPITKWLPGYPREWLRPDLVSALTSWGVMVPVALAYAELAGMPASVGIVTAMAALAAYAVLGTSRHLKVTTSSTMAVMSFSVVAPVAQGDPASFVGLTATLALLVGAMLLAAGLLRLGFLSDFLAKPVVTGFIVGVSITIIIGQLPKLFGIPGSSGNVFEQLRSFVTSLGSTNLWTLALGAGALILILVLRLVDRRIPGPLVALAVSIPLVVLLDLTDKGVSVVGPVETGVPVPSLTFERIGDLAFLAAGAAGLVFLALGESIGAARAFAGRHGYRVDPDQELIALGGSNVAAGLFGGFSVDASLSQTATGEAAGNRSQLASLVTAALLLLTTLVLAPLFRDLPQAVLGAIVIASVISLVDLSEFRRYIGQRRTDFALAIVAMVGVVTTTVLVGLVIAAALSLVMLLYRASQPALAVLGRISGPGSAFGDVTRHPGAVTPPGQLALRLDTPIYYFNANEVESRVLRLVDAADPRPRRVVLDIGATGDLDVTTGDMLLELVRALGERDVQLVLAQAKGQVRDRMERVGLMDVLGVSSVVASVADGVEAPFAGSDGAPAGGSDAATPAQPAGRPTDGHVAGDPGTG